MEIIMSGYVTLHLKGEFGALSDEDNRRCTEVFNTGKPVLVSVDLSLFGFPLKAIGYATYGRIEGLVTASVVVHSGSLVIITLNESEPGKFTLDWTATSS